ncbi:YfiR family protein [Photobacterium leiognathi]|uniref:YfiR family protein n=1 Tax=Photobacterium leiognathi TaxID=553611 RepID=UPI002738F8E6|nr:YfiR family protein [Photobacterium leiognathi]
MKQKMERLIGKPYYFCRLYILYFVVALALCINTLAHKVHAHNAADYEISAVYIYCFSQFITWPKTSEKINVLAILGTDKVALTLSRLLKANNIGNNIVTLTNINQIDQRQIVYISPQREQKLNQIPIEQRVLTIGSGQSFLNKGGMIELRSMDNKVRPAIALVNAKRAKLSISSKLLKIAILPKLGTQPEKGSEAMSKNWRNSLSLSQRLYLPLVFFVVVLFLVFQTLGSYKYIESEKQNLS